MSAGASGRINLASVAVAACLLLATVLLFATSPIGGDFSEPDATRHAMDGVFVHDLIVAHPTHGLKAWAIAYYFRHPALAIMFYPPLFAALEAIAFLPFGASHAGAQLVVSGSVLLLGASSYALAREIMPRWAALGAALLVIGTPATALWAREVMLDVPAYAFAAASAASLARYLRNGRAPALYAAVMFMLAAIYTKYNAGFVLPAFVLAFVLCRPWQIWRDRAVLGALALGVIGLIPAAALFITFGRLNMQSISGIASDMPVSSIRAWLYYSMLLPAQMGWPAFVVSLAGLPLLIRAALKPGGWLAAMLLSWLLLAYLLFSFISLKSPRLDLMILLPLCLAAGLALSRLLPRNIGGIACLALGAGVMLQSAVFGSVPKVDGYRQIAGWIGNAAPKDAVVVFSGYRDGNLIFDLMTFAGRPDIAVVRADKLLLSVPSGERALRGATQRGHDEKQIAGILQDIGPDYVVLQPGFWHDLREMALFEQIVHSAGYRPIAHFDISGDLSSQDGTQGITIYAPTQKVKRAHKPLTLEMPDIGGQFQGSLQ